MVLLCVGRLWRGPSMADRILALDTCYVNSLALPVMAGALFVLIGSLGLIKLSDLMRRLHGPTKASTLGVGCVLLASMGYFAWHGEASLLERPITAFVFLTAPVSAQMLAKADLPRV